MSFSGLSVLFIGIGFYDYEKEIVNRIKEQGGQVTALTERPLPLFTRPWGGLLAKFSPVVNFLQSLHEKKILKKVKNKKYDKVLIIKANDCSYSFIKNLRDYLPDSEFIMYQWDSLKRFPGVIDKFKFFDRILSFDRKDVEIYPMIKFRPLFYRAVSGENLATRRDSDDPYKYDLLFVGLMHSSRLAQVRLLQKQAKEHGLRMHVFLITNIPTWVKLWFKGQSQGVHLRQLSYKEVILLNNQSKCILDLPHPDQTGLTMRAIESIGFQKKIITTGKDITNYDFFDPEMINVIEMDNPVIDFKFLVGDIKAYSKNVKEIYSMDKWLDDVFFNAN
ncbi:hypothetical protein Bresa_02400|uniref:Lipopolysaccharide biosynthesis protein n=1 Tax=Brenneria salicis ATCC 15712 = DSM 30166 TaxID=714314 RepID=A0A366I1B5_9GAMM|nr:hypothetical protein [Brenneria salicis]NMN92136.1 hypothetical protein [Brenneria salicis ATCC 15712 = DSM 30166]RBP61126.1 hypothetical protein DES54_12734 [Brenneria salicis ATCC 15712 = DSM 30166]RLM29822.1 hypothetical protein BHG07_14205 [Brenneria salicis ATCC 15712 = DSM 30166]